MTSFTLKVKFSWHLDVYAGTGRVSLLLGAGLRLLPGGGLSLLLGVNDLISGFRLLIPLSMR